VISEKLKKSIMFAIVIISAAAHGQGTPAAHDDQQIKG
jgi:hypothetical protein